MRTTHLAARAAEDIEIVMSHAAEKCDFANRLAAKNRIDEVLHTDVKALGESWAKGFVEDALKKECMVILVMAGFPCKGLSRNRIDDLPNKGFDHQETGLFTEIPRILSLLRRLAKPKGMLIHHIVENVCMPYAALQIVCSLLKLRPIMLQAAPLCPASRPPPFQCSLPRPPPHPTPA